MKINKHKSKFTNINMWWSGLALLNFLSFMTDVTACIGIGLKVSGNVCVCVSVCFFSRPGSLSPPVSASITEADWFCVIKPYAQ